MQTLTVVMAQIDTLVGDIDGNAKKIIEIVEQAVEKYQADIVLFPELTLTGYPPEDLLLRESLGLRVDESITALLKASRERNVCMVIGAPIRRNGALYNSALAIAGGEVIGCYDKQRLPNYQVFDEHRYFTPGNQAKSFTYKGVSFGLTICEDVWHEAPVRDVCQLDVACILNLNASPFHQGKPQERIDLLKTRIADCAVPIIYTNAVGAQDELVFDGGSIALDAKQQLNVQAPLFKEQLCPVVFDIKDQQLSMRTGVIMPQLSEMESIYEALVLGVKDYVQKNGFKGALLGLSGGIDSALTLAIAADAIGADRVMAVMMPFRYTSQMSKDDAAQQAKTMHVEYDTLAIEPMYEAFMGTLAEQFEGLSQDTTEQNIQARCRAVLLMAISNKKGYLLLTTGNKSEVSVGYCTLYGDMAGGFNPLKNLPKTMVFQLSRFINARAIAKGGTEIIPQRVIDRPPSAELAEDQKDEDSLPPYDVLDAILYRYVEQDRSAEAIIREGFDAAVVNRVLRLVDLSEYKRRQAAIGVRISQRDFGRDRRYPITNGWKIGR